MIIYIKNWKKIQNKKLKKIGPVSMNWNSCIEKINIENWYINEYY